MMLDFALSPEEAATRAEIRRLAEERLAMGAIRHDQEATFPWEDVRLLAEAGYLGMQLPTVVGGGGRSYVSYAIAVEEVARVSAATALILDIQNGLYAETLWRFGDPGQVARFLPPCFRGEELGAFCLTEPEAGSDAAALACRAERVPGGYRLNGTKAFVSLGGVAEHYLVFAVTDPLNRREGISLFLVDRTTEGVQFGPPLPKLGIRAIPTCTMLLEDVIVPEERRIGAEGQGYAIALAALAQGRIGVASQAVGILSGALDVALSHARTRRQFGRRLGDFQAIQWMLADMATDLEAARLLTYRVAWLHGRGETDVGAIAAAKLFASEAAMRGCLKAVQILGGYGYTALYPVERYLRDAKITEIYEGTSEIQRWIIARALLRQAEKAR